MRLGGDRNGERRVISEAKAQARETQGTRMTDRGAKKETPTERSLERMRGRNTGRLASGAC